MAVVNDAAAVSAPPVRYLERVHAVASDDAEVCRRFFDVLNLLASPTSLMAPTVAWRVLARSAPRGASTPWGLVPPVDTASPTLRAH